ncbi:CBS domain-containing protein [Desulfopila aestuarii]|uniref:NanoRNase/pAp phosphatase, hydrolyzes c-di-AMP and oligoRNAs n=1 Tax=Desulfopila aestuarii DSM 18488 TaxID=1121416 RepID=A0A1M7Y906_9BACT|nr:CBS domain-containing protein [Desulfopila aestuarii]SHO49061.1 nanoRNase/pAp phosphatase, hydrolyzes c-di-AMP and oligoRNAs [Desulfopila aestuarii DSM 18488]
MQIVTSHKQTDFDALASIVAATLLYPGSVGVVPKETSRNVSRFLSTHKTAFNLILPQEVEHDKVTRLIVVDTASWQRLDRMDKLKKRTDLDIHLWDHHALGGDIQANWVCQEDIGATVTLFVREMKKREMELNPLISTILLIGLYEDTGHLTFPSTTPEDAYAAAFLLENGADLHVASTFLNPPYEEKQKEILFEMMKSTEKRTISDLKVGFNIVPLEDKITTLSSVVNIYRSIINVDAIFVIFVTSDRATVIGRSGVESINIGLIMSQLGGGGHAGAGSATIRLSEQSAVAIRDSIIKILENEQQASARIADLMSFPVSHVTPDTPMREVHTMMSRRKIRGVLVMENDELQGIIVLWDFKKLKNDKHWDKPVKAYMARDLISVAPDAIPAKVGRLMLEKNIGHLPVVQDNKVIGIVTRTDILNYFYNLLPE